MKKRIQKYLSGSNEGFSLVELIIVIAIMAILVGVIALAVIPNLEKSRESKDLATLDSLVSGVSTAIANDPSISGSGTLDVASVTSAATGKLEKAVYQQLGDISGTTMVSSVGKAGSLVIEYNIGGTTASNVTAYVTSTAASGNPSPKAHSGVAGCKYTKDDNGYDKELYVSNGK